MGPSGIRPVAAGAYALSQERPGLFTIGGGAAYEGNYEFFEGRPVHSAIAGAIAGMAIGGSVGVAIGGPVGLASAVLGGLRMGAALGVSDETK